MAKERSPSVAKTSLDTVFKVARLDLAELARKDVFSPAGLKTLLNPNSVLDTPLAQHISNFTERAGTAIASLLPDTLGPLPLKNGYVQVRHANPPHYAFLACSIHQSHHVPRAA